ncbi:ABC transporter permease [Thermopetrobacter sp. TC1]|uniref:ABC transporter permease n=1 Tax=Thermopetrobacter sp. TC1 TaxID=1495045 RepID=UPI000570A6C6|nr:ABC transporter permease subunit [Thermopetrobacter sp. TC1]
MSELIGLLRYGDAGWGDELLAGLSVTVSLALATLPFGLLLGLLLALAQISGERNLMRAARIYTTIFRGLPELLTIFIVYYGGQMALQALFSLFSDTYVEVNAFLAGMVALGLVFSAYASEVFLSAFQGIPKGQWEGAHALGLSRLQTFLLVIMPQVLRLALGGLSNLWLILLKETSLVSVIALNELLRMTSVAVGVTKQPILFYSVACLIYLTLSLISERGLARLENRLKRGEGVR